MDAREERGLIIAATCRLNRMSDGTWLVPSQTRAGQVAAYQVNLEKKTCTCPDHQEGGFKCKHIFAVEFTAKREQFSDGTVAVRWLTPNRSTVVWASLDDFKAVHVDSHPTYGTEIVWSDEGVSV